MIVPGALRALRTPTAFSADDRRDLLDQFVRLKLRSEFFRDYGDYCNVSVFCAREENWAVEFRLQRVHDSLQQFSIGIWHFGDA